MRVACVVVVMATGLIVLPTLSLAADPLAGEPCPAGQGTAPNVTDFPFMGRMFGNEKIAMGALLADLKKVLQRLGKETAAGDKVIYEVKPADNMAFEVPSAKLEFEKGRLVWCRITYQVDPGPKPPAAMEKKIVDLLGPIDGYVQDKEGGKHKAWAKGNVAIAAICEGIWLGWYTIEMRQQEGPIQKVVAEGTVHLTVKDGITVPAALRRLLEADVRGLDPNDASSIDKVFAKQVVLGHAFFKRYVERSKFKQYVTKAMFRMPMGTPPKTEVFEGGVLDDNRRLIPLIHPEFEVVMKMYRTAILRNATEAERNLFYAMIDFEIAGQPVYVLEAKEGRLLVYLDDKGCIKYIEYLDSWNTGSEDVTGHGDAEAIRKLLRVAASQRDAAEFVKAERTCKEAMDIARRGAGEDSVAYDICLVELGAIREDAGEYAQAEVLYRDVIERMRKVLGEENEGYVAGLTILARLYVSLGAYDKAEQSLSRIVEIRKRTVGENHPDYIESLRDLGGFYLSSGEFRKAESALAKVVSLSRAGGEETPGYASALLALGTFHVSTGEHAKAEPLLTKAVQILERLSSNDMPTYITALSNLAALYDARGEMARAESLYLKALEAERKAHGETHPAFAASLMNLGHLYGVMGNYANQIALVTKALQILEKSPGKTHPTYAQCLNNLAEAYRLMGEYAKAERLYSAAMRIEEKTLPKYHPAYTTLCTNMAHMYELTGNYAKAEALHQQALAGASVSGHTHSPLYAKYLTNLGALYFATGKYDKAEPLIREALAISAKSLGEDHPDYASGLNNLAQLYERTGQGARAEPLLSQCIEIRRRALGEGHPDYARALHNLAVRYLVTGELEKAETLFLKAAEITGKALGDKHPEHAENLVGLAFVYAWGGKPEKSLQHMHEGLGVLHRHALGVLPSLPEERQLGFLQKVRGYLDGYLSTLRKLPSTKNCVSAAAEDVANWTMLVAEVQAERNKFLRLEARGDQKKLLDDLRAAQGELACLTFGSPKGLGGDEIRQRRGLAEKRVADLEARIGEVGEEYIQRQRIGGTTLTQVAAALPVGSVLLDFVRFRDLFAADGEKAGPGGNSRYLVFVTPAGGASQTAMVDLGPAGAVDDAVAVFRSEIARIEAGGQAGDERGVIAKLEVLSKLVLAPLLSCIKDSHHLVVCPDGQLSLVPFECLRTADGKYLVETSLISYLGAGREAVAYAKAGAVRRPTGKPVLVGDPDFDLTPEDQQKELTQVNLKGSSVAMRGVGGSRDLRQIVFTPLPGTQAEIDLAGRLIGGTRLLKRQALEGAVKQVAAPEILYAATHGFCLADQEWGQEDRPRSPAGAGGPQRGLWGGLVDGLYGTSAWQVENPLLRCGLALAGANRREAASSNDSVDDGLLTAMEVTGLDLWGTKLVVLSACQTGLGQVQQGEGVMGLRRAFLLAGARRVLASLWRVSDKHTQELMSDFLRQWQGGTPAPNALRKAQLAMITRLRQNQGSAHPFFWAAFTLMGDPTAEAIVNTQSFPRQVAATSEPAAVPLPSPVLTVARISDAPRRSGLWYAVIIGAWMVCLVGCWVWYRRSEASRRKRPSAR